MIHIFLIILVFFSSLFAMSEDIVAKNLCPAETPRVLTMAEINAKIQECVDARATGKEAGITDFYCPGGTMTEEDSRPLTLETLAYHVAVSIQFAEIDKKALTAICAMKESREKDGVKYVDFLTKNFWIGNSAESINDEYIKVCAFPYIANKVNLPIDPKIRTTETYPQSICIRKATQKTQAWLSMGYILASEWIAKSYTNDKSKFVDKVKWSYKTIIDKFHRYLQTVERGNSKVCSPWDKCSVPKQVVWGK
jgi:hypothetical protein